MEWKQVADIVAKSAPMLGGLLAGPPGAAVGAAASMIASAFGVGATPAEVAAVLTTDPNAAVKLREIESTRQVELQRLVTQESIAQITAAVQNMAEVNSTMRAESLSERWPQYWWRPVIGFAVGFNTSAASALCVFVFTPLLFGGPEGKAAAAAAMAHLPTVIGALVGINTSVLPILGIASWFRGKQKLASEGASA